VVDTTHDHLHVGKRHRADEIHLHPRERRDAGLWPWLLLGAIGLLALWAILGRVRYSEQAQASDNCAANIEFAALGSIVPTANRGGVEKLASCLKSDPDLRVRVQGHASPAEMQTNPSLARERAESIGRALASLGVSASQVSVETGQALCNDGSPECARRNHSVSVRAE
jgi:hypothetical protein